MCPDAKMLVFALTLWMYGVSTARSATGTTVSPPDNKGQQFILMFMENLRIGTQKFPLELYVTTPSKQDVHVHITSPKWSSPKVDETFTIKDGDVQKTTIDSIFRMVGDGISPKALLITADGDVACYGANKETLSNDVYLGLPVDALGTDYYAVTYSPASIKTEVGMACTDDGTNIGITLPSGNGNLDVTFKGQTYHAGGVINVNCDKYDAVQIQSTGDLTGAHIVSNKPVAAFSGNIKTTVDVGTFSDHLVEQLVPTDRWGEKFVTAPTPGRTVGDIFKIIAKTDNTVVTIPGKQPVSLSKGQTYSFELPSNQYSSITSTEPIMLAQFVKTQRSGSEPADPSMMIIPPYEQFGSDYTFTTPEYSHPEYGPTFRYENEFMIVAKKSETSGLLLDGKPFPQTTWHDIPGTDLVGSSVTLPHGAHTVRHSNPLSTFGGYLYGHAYHESYGFPTGMRTAIIYDPHCQPTVSVPGDGIDNDCDNKIDEELCTPDNHNKDDDGDGRHDEDCVKTTPIDGLWGKWGKWGTKCSVTCGDGVVRRTRACDAPAPKFGGKNCTGTDSQTKTCYGGTPCGIDIASICAKNHAAIVANPLNCAQYFDCSKTSPFGQSHLFECPYPQLFDNSTLRCADFPTVTCGRRHEPKAPCEYLQNKCNGSDPTCKPCAQRLASCVGDPDGKQAMAVFAPQYKDCKTDRTMGQGKCPMGYFNPQAHRCMPHNPGTLSFYCRQHKTELLGEPHSCAKYIDCAKPGATAAQKTAECKYPDLFSLDTGHCENFTTVNCTTRPEPQAPCEYDQNKCPSTNHTCKPCPQVHANCVGQTDGIQSYPGRQWGPEYAQCLLNRTLSQKQCPSGQYFHPVTKKCTDKVKPGEVPDVCKANPTLVFADEQNCAKYYDCSANHSALGNHVMECTYPDLFSTTTKRCEQFDTVTCGKRPEPMAPCEYDQNKCKPGNSSCVPCSGRLPSCVGQTDGNQKFTTREWKPDYVVCHKNRTTLPTKKCTKGYFHPVLKKCTEDVNKPDAKPFCQANPTAVVPVKDNCAQYIDCPTVNAGGSTANPVQECKYPALFSTVTMTCEAFTTVTCKLRKEPQAPCEYDQNKCQPNDPSCVVCSKRLPSCVGLSDGDHAFVTREWKPDYVTCNKNRTVIPTKNCTKGYFHPVLNVCKVDVAKPDAKPFCQANPTAVVPVKDNCAQYIDCPTVNAGGSTANPVQECKYPALFSTVTMTCEAFTTVTCKLRKEPQAPCEYDQNKCQPNDPICVVCSKRLPSCVGLSDGDHAFVTREWKPDYVTCNKNRTVIPTKNCTKGYFHPVLNVCKVDVAKPDAKPFCQANPTAVVPVKDNCAQYIDCPTVNAGGSTANPVQECKYPALFSTVTMTCEAFTTVTCKLRKEPQAPCEYDQNKCQPNDPSCVVCSKRLPSCVGLSDGDHAFVTREWKPDYVTCNKNRTVIPTKNCTKGYFHPVLNVCMVDVAKPDAKPFCQANPTAVVPVKDNCAQYIDCPTVNAGGSTANPVQECKYPALFSTVTMTCEAFTTVTCKLRKEPQAPCEYDQNKCPPNDPSCVACSKRLPSCVGLSDGDHAFVTREWKPDYVTCNKNRTIIPTKKCTKGYFHPVLNVCKEDIAKPDAKPYCQANPLVTVPMADNCAQYINCSAVNQGMPATDPVQECKYPDLFSTLSMTCQDFTTVVCDKRKEPQAPCEYKQNVCNISDPACIKCSDRLPSCVSLTDGDQMFPTRQWKPDYVTCYKNRTVIPTKKCPTASYFHPTLKRCTKDVKKPDAKPYCQANPMAIVPTPDDCAQYINCTQVNAGGSSADPVQECNYPDLFSMLTMHCQDFTTVTCGTRREPQAPCEYKQNLCATLQTANCVPCQQRLPSCVQQMDGDQPFPGKQWKEDFIHCYKNRTMTVDKCPSGAVFDPTTKSCTTKINAKTADPFCSANPKAVKVNPLNCAQYYNCSAPAPPLGHHLVECSYPDLFSTTTMRCEQFETVQCTNRTEPKAPCEYMQNLCSQSDPTCMRCPSRLPSCVGLSDGKHPFPSKEWKPDYITCYKNRTVIVTRCQTGYFHPMTGNCTKDVKKPDAKPYCIANPNDVLPMPDNCAQVLNCSSLTSGSAMDPVQECKYPDLFSTVTRTCQDFTTVHCDKRPEPQAPCEYQKNKVCPTSARTCPACPDRLPSCRGLADGVHPFPGKLWMADYITCYKNRTQLPLDKCAQGMYFHPTKMACTKDITKVDATPYCKAHPHSIIPMVDNCAHYIDCPSLVGTSAASAQPIAECKYPDLFSVVTMTCQSFTTVTCDTRPEPQAPCEYDQNKCAPNDTQCQPCPLRLPSCIGQTDGAQPFPTRLWKSDYIQCYKNRTMALRNCSHPDVFDPQDQACITRVPPNKMDSFCKSNPTVVMADPDNCAKYYNCSDPASGLGHHLDECKYPDLFSETTHGCKPFETVTCKTRKEPKAPCEYQKNMCKPNDTSCVSCPDRLPSCVGQTDGNHTFPPRMWGPDYITCKKDRTVSLNKCHEGYFHPVTETCTKNVTRVDAKKFCQANPTSIIPTTDDCAQYFNCSSPDPVQECHYPDLFSTVTMSCQDFTTVQCDKRMEPKAPCEYKQNLCDSSDISCQQCKDRLPSCVGVSDGDHAFPTRLWKPDYITCYNNRTVIPTKKCPRGFFHPIHENCTETVTKTDAKPYCQANPRDVLPTQGNCAKFYNCTRTLLGYPDVVQECQYPDLFSTLSMTCQDFTTVQCDKRQEPQAPCEYDQNQCPANNPSCASCPLRLPSCVGLPDGDQVAAGYKWTDVYVRCYKNRTMSVEHCPNGAVFDPSRKICVSKIRSGDIASFCQSNPGSVKPHDTNCAQYYNCSAPHSPIGPYTQECPYPDLFSTTTRRCEQFETVPCGNRQEPQPPCAYLQNRCNGSDPNCLPCQERLPSCVGLPDGFNPVPNKKWSPQYVDCYKNRTVAVTQCSTQYFHPTLKKCVDKLDRGDVQDFCKENPTAIILAEDNCAQYYNCSQPARDVMSECKYPDLFSRFFKSCGPFRQTLCDTRPEPQAPCEYDKNLCSKTDPTCEPCPERLPSCKGLPDGANPHPYHRWGDMYVECYLNRTMAVTTCNTGYFHPRNLQCTIQVDPVDVPDYCSVHAGEIITNPDNCATYYNCSSSSNGHVVECKYPQLYDVTSQACADFTTVVCNLRPELKAPCQYQQNLCDPSDSDCKPCLDRLPSCVGLSDGAHAFQGKIWQTDYVTCNKNRTSDVTSCKAGYFHPRLRTCVTRIDKPDIPDFCTAHPSAIIPNPDSCAQYVNCSDPGFMKECTYPDLFAADTMTCTKFTRVNCDVRPEPQAPCEYSQNQCAPGDTSCSPCTRRLPSCVGTPDGAQPFTGREWTDDYVECYKNRTMSLNKCPPGAVFDATQKACVSKIDKGAIQSFCQYNSHALKEVPDNCAQYFDCSKPTSPLGPYLMECDYPQLFNSQFSMCVDFGIARRHCGTKKEPQAPCDYLRNLCSPTDKSCVPCPSRLPSCVGLPDGTQPVQGRLWEPDYIECRENRTINVQKCQKGYFHPQRKVCVDTINQVDIPGYCQVHRNDIIEDPRSCSRYFNCSALSTPLGNRQMECSYPDLFSATFKSCMQFQNVDCRTKAEPQAPCEYVANLCHVGVNDTQCTPCPLRLPSCKGSPDGNNPHPGHLWKADYIVCYKNRTVYTERCTQGFFNPRTKTCVETITPVDAIQYCNSNPGDVFPDPGSCSKYYNCSNVLTSQTGPEECSYPDLFSPDTKRCEPFNTVTCKHRPEPQAPCEYDQNLCAGTNTSCIPCPARLPSCVGLSDGQQVFGIQQWSDKYMECSQNRTVAVRKCPTGTYFSPQDRKCTRNINQGSITDFCRANPTIVRPHPNNCAQYYDCSALAIGLDYLKECPYPDLFDITNLTCTHFSVVQCGVRYEPKQPCEYVKNQCSPSQVNCKPCPERHPSCVGLVDGNHPYPGLTWHPQFIVCDHDRTTMTTHCPGTAVFNPNTKHCVDVTHLTKYEFLDYCKAYPSAVLADPNDCSRYYDCKQVYSATQIQFQCNYPDLFSLTENKCVNFTRVQCGTRKEPTAPCQYDHNMCKPTDTSCLPCPSRQPDCKGLPDGDNGVPGELWSVNFIHCEKDRTMEVKHCQKGVFDPTSRTCSETVGPQHMRDICTANSRIIIQHPTNCAQYFNCSEASTTFGHYLMECSYPLLFDTVTLQCRLFTSVQCGPKTEPQAPCQYFRNLCPSGNHTCMPCKDRLPSCVGLPDGPNMITNKLWTQEYVECSRNRTGPIKTCRTGTFDPVQRSCVDSINPVDIPKYCAANPKATVKDPNNCAKYFDCSTPANNYRHECKYPMLFSDQTSGCDDFRSVFCGSRPQPQTPCEYSQNQCALGDLSCVPCQSRLPSCKGLPDGVNGDPIRLWTSVYIQCLQNRTVTQRACADGVFDPVRRSCVKNIDPSKINDVCRANPSSVFPDPQNCAKYYDCRSVQSFSVQLLKECQYPDLFSSTTMSCQKFDTVRCDSRHEPQAPCDYTQNHCSGAASCVPCKQRLPDCIALQDGANVYKGRIWSQDFVICQQNRTMKVDHCAPGSLFDPIQRQCAEYINPARLPEFCQMHPTTVVPSGRNAAQFYNCSAPSGGLPEPYVHECKYPDIFDARYLLCRPFTQVPKDKRPVPQAPCQYEKNLCLSSSPGCTPCPQRLYSCIGLPDGNNGIEGKSWVPEYIKCYLNRTIDTGKCDHGVFDPLQRQCVAKTQPGPVSIPEQCRRDPQKLIPHPGSCSLYYNCSQTISRFGPFLPAQLEECKYPDLFSTVYHRCMDFQSVKCDGRNEVQAPCQYLQNQCDPIDITCEACPRRLPSCVGLPDGNNAVIGKYWSQEFVHCFKNRTLDVSKCPTGFFHPVKRICTDSLDKGDVNDFCKANPTAVLPNTDNCAKFHDCAKLVNRYQAPVSRQQSLSDECRYPDLFSTISLRCEPFTKVNCGKRPEPQAPCEYAQNLCQPSDSTCVSCSTRLPSCVGLGEGSAAIPGREYTDSYVTCHLNRTMGVNKCQKGFFDAGIRLCVTNINSANIRPYCKTNPHAVLPHPTNCAWYYNCSITGRTLQSVYPFDVDYVQECPYPQLFSSATMQCEQYQRVSCNGHFEPQAPCEYFKNRCDPASTGCVPCPNRLLSCKNLPDGEQIVTNYADGLKYLVECGTNRTLSHQLCKPSMYQCASVFPATTAAPTTAPSTSAASTLTTSAPDATKSYCQSHPYDVVAHETNCAMFYDCNDLFTIQMMPVKECHYPLLFNPIVHACTDFHTTRCVGKYEPQAPCDYIANQCHGGACIPCPQRFPSCVGLSDGNHAYPGKASFYIRCQGNRTIATETCGSQLFDATSRQCMGQPQTGSIQDYCRLHPFGRLAYPNDCAQYYDCSQENSGLGQYINECTYPNLFDDVLMTCRDRSLVRCGQRPIPRTQCDYKLYKCVGFGCPSCSGQTSAPTTPAPTTPAPQTGPSCVGTPNGLNPYPGKPMTGYYIVCDNGHVIETGICIVDKILDPVQRRCTDPANSEVIDAYCRIHPGSVIPSVNQCAQYYRCGNDVMGRVHDRNECVYPQLFSTVDNTCKSFTDVQCGQRVEPVAPCEYIQNQCSPTDSACVPCSQRMPSCVGLPDGLNPSSRTSMSPNYVVCEKGRTVEYKRCIVGYFDPSYRTCKGSNPVITTRRPIFYTQPTTSTTPLTLAPTQPPTGPSCVGKPDGLNPYPGRPLTGHYIVCSLGRVIETGICIVDEVLDPVSRRCTYPADPDVIDRYCKVHPGSAIPSVSNCAQYYTCGGTFLGPSHELHECTYPQLFSTVDNTCKHFTSVQCGQRIEPVSPCDYSVNQCSSSDPGCVPCSQRMPSCVGLPDGPNPYPNAAQSSASFIVCSSGRTTQTQTCASGYFDTVTRTCKTQSLDKVGAFCQMRPVGVMRDDNHCAQYYSCVTENTRLRHYKKECPYPELFDDILNMCRDRAYVRCGTRPIPRSPCDYELYECIGIDCLRCPQQGVGLIG